MNQPNAAIRRSRAVICASVVLAGCGVADAELTPSEAEAAQQDIFGGSVDNGDPAVVAIYFTRDDGPHGCTGTLIAPTAVLTAGHCVTTTKAAGIARNFEVRFGVNTKTGATQRIASTAQYLHPGFVLYESPPAGSTQTPPPLKDLAILKLASAPVGVNPMPLVRVGLSGAWLGRTVRAVGYGGYDATRDYTFTDFGTKRQVSLNINSVGSDTLTAVRTAGGAMPGDSGGPALYSSSGQWYVAGVASTGAWSATGVSTVRYAQVSADLTWLDAALKVIDGSSPCAGRENTKWCAGSTLNTCSGVLYQSTNCASTSQECQATASGAACVTPAPRLGTFPKPNRCTFMFAGEALTAGDVLTSCDGLTALIYQGDGNVVLYEKYPNQLVALWSTGTVGQPLGALVMQGDGNLVLYANDTRVLWNSGTYGNAGGRLQVQDDCKLVTTNGPATAATWATNTGCRYEGVTYAEAFNANWLANYNPDVASWGASHGWGPLNYQQWWESSDANRCRQASPVLAPATYLAIQPDVNAAYGGSCSGAVSHWLSNGNREGRQSSPQFAPRSYLARYPDLAAAYGPHNYGRAAWHYMNYGIYEGRYAGP